MNNGISYKIISRYLAACCFFVIIVALLWGRKLQNTFPAGIDYFTELGVVCLLSVIIIAYYHFRYQLSLVRPFFLLFVLTLFFALITLSAYLVISIFVQTDIEQMHLVKYGFFAFFIFYGHSSPSKWKRFIVAMSLSSLVGISEEVLQIWVPERVFDYKDIRFNLVSCFIGSSFALFFTLLKNKLVMKIQPS
ncbi:MAG: VanZ family protein [Deltaproteobacteria bacterium]|nr:VanZ family protein [Deltaproteobacteria bacterium]